MNMKHSSLLVIVLMGHVGQVWPARVIISTSDNSNKWQSPSHAPLDTLGDLSNEIQWGGEQRPLYNIAHMSNSIAKTMTSLSRGANAVEVDVSFNRDDITLYHGYPCDCFRYCWDGESLDKYLTFARKITTPGHIDYNPRFVILYFDLKLTKFNSAEKHYQGVRFANTLARNFFTVPMRSTLKLVASISYAPDVDFFKGLIRRLHELNLYEHVKDHIGFDVGMDTEMDRIREIWSQLNVSNVWQGEGITNCINPIIGHQLEQLVQERDRANSHCQKVYRWTIDLSDSIKSALGYGIDGIMTNHPERVVAILREPEFARSFRLATTHDNPFSKLPLSASGKAMPNTSTRDKLVTLIKDTVDSVFYFVLEVMQSIFRK